MEVRQPGLEKPTVAGKRPKVLFRCARQVDPDSNKVLRRPTARTGMCRRFFVPASGCVNQRRRINMSTATLGAPWASLSIKIDTENPDHHLWNNHGTWWIHYTVHQRDYTKRRVRVSLETRNLREARQRRNTLFAHLEEEGIETT
jgi:hypothetical protein